MKGLEDTEVIAEGFVGAKRNGLVILHDQSDNYLSLYFFILSPLTSLQFRDLYCNKYFIVGVTT